MIVSGSLAAEPGSHLSDDTLLYWRSPILDALNCELAVTIPTFKRPEQLIETVQSVAAQIASRHGVIIIIENEAENREGAQAATRYMAANGIVGLVIVVVKAGNCNAYNGGWRTVRDHFPNVKHLAVIDDDETADADWLEELMRVQAVTNADFVGGPQVPIMPISVVPSSASALVHPVFRPAYSKTGPVPVLYSSGNLLLARRVIEDMPFPFLDPAFNFTGGGDADLYERARVKGFTFAWANAAILREPIPERRLQKDWLRARALRNGALSAIIERRKHGEGFIGRARVMAKSFGLLAASPFRALVTLLRTGSFVDAVYKIEIGVGRVMGEFGLINEQYRNPEKN
jgi:GT2 family glycosyltransferase